MSAADNAAKSAASPASGAAPKDAPPLIAPTGNAPLDVLAGDINKVASQYDVLTSNDASSLDKAKAGLDLVLGIVQTPVNLLNDGFALATAGIAKLFPALPAATLGMLHLGWPHVHMHPPTYIPPAIFIPLPSLGGVALSGCVSVLINGVPAARAGDLGIALICCSFAPPFEVFTGSSKVFIGGARAARMGDITKHCQPNMDGVGKAISGIQKVVAIGGKVMGVAGIASEAMGAVAKATEKKKPAKAPKPSGPDPVQALGNALVAMNAAATAAKAEAAAKTAAAAVSAASNAGARADAEDAADNAADAAAEAEAVAAATAALLEAEPQEEPEEPEAETDTTAAAVRMGVQAGLDAAAMAAGFLMGMDPGAPPCFGALLSGMPNVLIGGFPMPPWGAVASGLGKLGKLKVKRLKKKHELDDCKRAGHPINPITGANEDEFVDYEEHEPVAFRWGRNYTSAGAGRDGPLGRGFRHGHEHRLAVDLDQVIYTDPRGRTTEIPLPEPDGETYGKGYVLTLRDEGAAVTYEIARSGEPTLEFVREPRSGAEARLTRMRTEEARTDVLYDEQGRLKGMIDTSAGTAVETRLVLDGRGHIVEVRRGPHRAQELPLVAAYAYDYAGRLVVFQDALGQKASYAYDAAHRVVRMTDRNGYSFHFAYDAEGRCVEEHGDDGLWRVALRYEPEKRSTIVTEADGGEWVYAYDENQTLVAIHDPYGGERQLVKDAEGTVTSELGADRRTAWRFLYDDTGRNYGLIDRYGSFHPPLDVEPNPPLPPAHRVPETALSQQWGMAVLADSAPFRHTLPAAVQAFVAALPGEARPPREPSRQWDRLGRLIEETDPEGRRRSWDHDANGNVVRFTDRDGSEHQVEIISWNLVGATVDPLGQRTSFGYTSHERVASTVDPGGSESRYEYDRKDRLVRVVRHGVVREEYAYDVGDRLVEKRDAGGDVLVRCANGANGLATEYALASGEVYRYAYDERGNVTRMSTGAGEVLRGFDVRRRLLFDERDGRGVRNRFVRGSLVETRYLGRFSVRYRRHPDGSLRISAPVGGEHCIQVEHNRVLSQLGNGTSVLSLYDEAKRCTGRVAWRARGEKTALWSVRYVYSAEGELRRVEDNHAGVTHYTYDAAHRLIGERGPDGATATIVLDAAGNVREKPGLQHTELLEGNRLLAAGRERFAYDRRNHLAEQTDVDGAVTRYHYNSLDMLVKVSWSDRDEVWTAGYDGIGRRLFKALGAARTEYFWEGNRLAAEIGPAGAVRVYVYAGPEALVPLLFIDYASADADPESGRIYYPIGDQLGVPLHIENEAGEVVWRAHHVEPHGTIAVHLGASIAYAPRFPGHYFDEETSLHYNRFRYYSPRLGRYLQSDPAGQSGGINLYAYPANPLVDVDVLGLAHTQHEFEQNIQNHTITESPSTSKKRKYEVMVNEAGHYEARGRPEFMSIAKKIKVDTGQDRRHVARLR